WSLCPRNTGARLGFPRRRPPPDGQAQLVRACPLWAGSAVRFEPECVFGFDRNHCSDSTGLHMCNVRIHGTTGERPIDRLAQEGLRSIEGVAPYRALALERRRVARDCFLSYAGSWYSVPAEYAGKEVWVRQTESELLVGERDKIIAQHPLAERAYQRKVVR